jgi:hypothetical protein
MGRVFVLPDKDPAMSMARLYNDQVGGLDQVSHRWSAGMLQM